MTRPVSVVLPSLGTTELLEENLPSVLTELDTRSLDDEVIVVDDTGDAIIEPWIREHFPTVDVVSRETNGGFARALASGVERARHELILSLNTDVRARPGFLDPLVACLQDESVFAVVPRVLLNGDEDQIESVTEITPRRGFWELGQPGLGNDADLAPARLAPVAFAVGGTCLFRKRDFQERGGFDPLYEPFYFEDVDFCWQAWRAGRQTLYQPASILEHHHRGTISKLVDPDFVRAAIEKNRLLFQWKFLDEPELLREHVAALYGRVADAWVTDQREQLVWLCLALEQLDELAISRRAPREGERTFGEIARASSQS